MHNFLYCNICITLNTWTCFEQYYAHLQEVKIVFLQHLVSSLSVSGRTVYRLRTDCSPLSTGTLKQVCTMMHGQKNIKL
jgi:hypothetical protein